MPSVKLVVQGIGHPVSFKNTKKIVRRRNGTPTLITDPKKQQWMDQCVARLESALRSWFQTNGIGIRTAVNPLYLIASLLPLDDSLKWIGSNSVNWRRVKKGEEGFEIEIERLP